MAARAGQPGMSIGEGKPAVVKRCRKPARGHVACSTILAILPIMPVLTGMAGKTIGWRVGEQVVDVAVRAGRLSVFSSQWEG
jgi:hypothetical protein